MLRKILRSSIVLVLPLFGIVLGQYLAGAGAPRLDERTVEALCLFDLVVEGRDISCLAADYAGSLLALAWGALGLALAPPMLFFAAALVCGRRRGMTAAAFPLLIPAALLLVCLNIVVQGMLAVLTVTLGAVAFLGDPPVMLLGVLIVLVFLLALAVIGGAVTLRFGQVREVRAVPLKRDTAPKLWTLVDAVAARVGAPPPDGIVLGLEPVFWMVGGAVRTVGDNIPRRRIDGRTLHLSLPLMHVLSEAELRAVIAHELAHFRPGEAAYTARFIPAYTALIGAEQALRAAEQVGEAGPTLSVLAARAVRRPSWALLNLLGLAFRRNVRAISARREAEADVAAAQATEPGATASALLKLPFYARLWTELHDDHIARIRRRHGWAPELGRYFGDMARLWLTPSSAAALRQQALQDRAAHPYDAHPPAAERLQALGADPGQVTAASLRPGEGDGVAEALLARLDEIEFFLMTAENDALYQSRAIPDVPGTYTAEEIDPLFQAVYSFFAAMVLIAPDPAVRFTALQKRGSEGLDGFDRLIFSGFCSGRRALMMPEDAVAGIGEGAGADGLAAAAEIGGLAIQDGGAEPGAEEAALLALAKGWKPGAAPRRQMAGQGALDDWVNEILAENGGRKSGKD